MWKRIGNPLKGKKKQRKWGPEMKLGTDLVPIRDRRGIRGISGQVQVALFMGITGEPDSCRASGAAGKVHI